LEVASVQLPVQAFGFGTTAKFRIHVRENQALRHSFVPDQLPV
jgi:hypothetical protein